MFTLSPGNPGAVVGVIISPDGAEPGIRMVEGMSVVIVVVGICTVVPVGAGTVVGTVVGMRVTSPPGWSVHPAEKMVIPMRHAMNMVHVLFMKGLSLPYGT